MAEDAEAFRVEPEVMEQLQAIASEDVTPAVAVTKALSDERRVKILRLLRESELCVCDLVEIFDLEYSKLSYHLKQLREAGVVRTDREGNFVTYELTERGSEAARSLEAFTEAEQR